MGVIVRQPRPFEINGISVSLEPAREVKNLASIWRDLETRSRPSFFLTWDWIGRWLAESGISPYLVTARHGDKIVALALLQPARLRRHRIFGSRAFVLNQIGDPDRDVITIEYNGFLVDREVGDDAIDACIRFLNQPRGDGVNVPRWEELHFDGVTADFQKFADRSGLMVWLYSEKPSWAIDLDAVKRSGRSYLDAISANTRYQIRRSMRLYEARGPLVAVRARSDDEALSFLGGLKELHQRYWESRGEPGGFAYPFFERFHRALILECRRSGTVEIMRIAAGEAVIGYLYNFVHAGWVGQYLSGFAYEEDAKLKPGLVSHFLCAQQHLQENAKIYDFMAGDNRYKASLGTRGPDLLHIILQKPIAKFRAERALRKFKQKLFGIFRETTQE